jgi:hypothetical protein
MFDEKNQLLEALEQTAENLLWRIHQVKHASDTEHRVDAEEQLYAEARVLQSQSGTLERYLSFEAQRSVYLGG